jgi:beta-lactamase class A
VLVSLNIGQVSLSVFAAESTHDLPQQIEARIGDFRGDIGIYAKNLHTGKSFSRNADERFPTASVCKVPVMVELFRLANEGQLNLNDHRRFSRDGISTHANGPLVHRTDAPELTLLEYCRLMIVHSDDMATDFLMQIADPANVTRTITELGFPQTRVSGNMSTMHYQMAGLDPRSISPQNDAVLLRRAQEGKLLVAGLADRSENGNVSTPREMGTIFERLEEGTIVSPQASRQMLDLLKQTVSRDLIPGRLPSETVVAHKIGKTWRVRADAGIVYLGDITVIISLFSWYDPEEKRANALLADLAELLIDSLAQ